MGVKDDRRHRDEASAGTVVRARNRRVAIILPTDTDLIDVAGPACVLSSAARCLVTLGRADEAEYVMDYLSVPGGSVNTRQGLTLNTQPLHEAAADRYDTVIVAGGENEPIPGREDIAAWLVAAWPSLRRVASVCTGAFFLGSAGLLDGRRATTHWMDCGRLARQFAGATVEMDAIFVEDDGVWTSAGATAGIDMALAMVEQDFGHELAMMVARLQVVFLKRHGGQSQYSVQLQSQEIEGRLAPLMQWVFANLDADLSTEMLATRANMSLRNFYRVFVTATGRSPALWIEDVRIENGKRLLSQTAQQADQIAISSGFGNYERMRRTFLRRLGISPLDYRKRFASCVKHPGRRSGVLPRPRPPIGQIAGMA